MAINMVKFGSETLIDLTADTVTPETLLSSATAHDKSGEAISGTIPTKTITPDVDDYIPFPQDYAEYSSGYYPNNFKIYAHLQEKEVTPQLLVNTTVTPDNNYALSKVIVKGYTIPDNYIDKGTTALYVTQSAEGTYTAGSSDTYLDDISINIGFKPKIFIFVTDQGMNTKNTSTYMLTNSFIITDNNYNIVARRSSGAYYNSTNGAVSAQGASEANVFHLTSNGVQGGSGSSFFVDSGKRMAWYAWG